MLLSPNSRSLFRAPNLSNSLRYVNSEWLREFEFTSAPLLTLIKVKTALGVNNISQYFFAHEGLCNFSLSLYIGRAGSDFNAVMLKSKAPGAFQNITIFGYMTIWKD
jgi:hypothetical protein